MKEKTLDLLMEEADGVSRVAAGTPIVLVQCLLDVENTGVFESLMRFRIHRFDLSHAASRSLPPCPQMIPMLTVYF